MESAEMWECPKCRMLTLVTIVRRLLECQQCGTELQRATPTCAERLAKLEAGLRGLREEYDIWERRAQRKDRCYAFAECRRRLDKLMRRNGISPDGEGGG